MKKTPFFHRHTAIQKLLILKALCIKVIRYFTVSGPIVTFFTNIAHPVTALKIGIEPVQAGSGDPSPDNIRAITGWDAVKVGQSGKNLFDADNAVVTTVDENNNQRYGVTIEGIGTYVIRATKTGSSAYIYVKIKNANGTYGSASSLVGESGYNGEMTKTLTEGQKLLIYDYTNDTESTAKTKLASWGIYVAKPTTHTASLPSTVYGGEVDWVNGKADSTYAMRVYNGSNDEEWTQDGSRFINSETLDIKTGDTTRVPVISNEGTYSTSATTVGTVFVNKNSKRLFYYPPTEYATDVTTFKAWLASNPLQIVYELATSTEIPLSDLDTISTLKGENNVWADTGDILLLTYAKKV